MIERKFLVHYVKVPTDIADFESKVGTASESQITWKWVRIGQHLESFSEEMNPQINILLNIWGSQSALHQGYQVSSNVDVFYATKNSSDNDFYLYQFLEAIALNRWTGDMCRTERIEALIDLDVQNGGTISSQANNLEWAWKEDCFLAPQSFGGDTSGVQIPFQISNLGNRENVTSKFTIANKVANLAA